MIKSKTYNVIDYRDLDELIRKELKLEKMDDTVVASDEMNNDSTHEFNNIDGNLDEYETGSIRYAIRNKCVGVFNTRNWLNWLAKVGKIPHGDYLVRVSW